MNVKHPLRYGLAVAVVSMSATLMSGTALTTDPSVSSHWRTLPGREVPLSWEWPCEARSAKLTIIGSEGTREVVFDLTASNYLWEVAAADAVPATERVFRLRMDFYRTEDTTGPAMEGVGLEADGLGFVGGIDGGSTELRPSSEDSETWMRTDVRRPVVPVPEGTTALSFNDVALPVPFAPGWAELPRLGANAVNRLSLTAGGERTADIRFFGPGFFIFIR